MKFARHRPAVQNLLTAAVAGAWTLEQALKRMAAAVGKNHRVFRPFLKLALVEFPTCPTPRNLLAFAETSANWEKLRAAAAGVEKLFVVAEEMGPMPWPVPPLTNSAALADFLHMTPGELDWFADVAGRNGRDRGPKLRHYVVRWLAKPNGTVRPVEAPKDRLKQAQRRILDAILSHIPLHTAVHGFVPGRSILTAALPHVGRAAVLKFDLADFFPSVTRARVEAIFVAAGYPEPVAEKLAGLCTTRLPADEWATRPYPSPHDHSRWQKLNQPHLPQGAPTSPALANLATYRLDLRLSAYAAACGAAYTRYADDLTLSGDASLADRWRAVRSAVARAAWDEGFDLNFRKGKVLRAGTRQRVLGVVVNEKLNVSRADSDALKAVLTNCVRHGPAAQNRDNVADFRGHLLGRVAFVTQVNPARGAKLRAVFDRIAWPTTSPCPISSSPSPASAASPATR